MPNTQLAKFKPPNDSELQRLQTLRVGYISQGNYAFQPMQDAAAEAGISRRYGGIHFMDGDLRGRAAEIQVGTSALTRFQAILSQ